MPTLYLDIETGCPPPTMEQLRLVVDKKWDDPETIAWLDTAKDPAQAIPWYIAWAVDGMDVEGRLFDTSVLERLQPLWTTHRVVAHNASYDLALIWRFAALVDHPSKNTVPRLLPSWENGQVVCTMRDFQERFYPSDGPKGRRSLEFCLRALGQSWTKSMPGGRVPRLLAELPVADSLGKTERVQLILHELEDAKAMCRNDVVGLRLLDRLLG